MNGNVRRNAKTAFVCVLFIIIVSLFFYLLTAGTMPESVDIPSADKIADVDLSKQGVGIDISSGEYYTGRLYTPDDFAKGNISQGDPDDKYATFRIVLPLEKVSPTDFPEKRRPMHNRSILTENCSARSVRCPTMPKNLSLRQTDTRYISPHRRILRK